MGVCGCGCDRYTYEMAPVFNLTETEVLQKMRELIGWSCGAGIFAPGGSVSNLYGLMAARHHRYPESRLRGVRDLPQMIIFTSNEVGHCLYIPLLKRECSLRLTSSPLTPHPSPLTPHPSPLSPQAHYSVEKIAIMIGLGTDNVVKIKCDHM